MSDGTVVVKVAKDSLASAVAGAIAGLVRDGKQISVQAIGVMASGIAVRAMALACHYLRQDNIPIAFIPHLAICEENAERVVTRLDVVMLPEDDILALEASDGKA